MSTRAYRPPMRRALASDREKTSDAKPANAFEGPRMVRNTLIDFTSLCIPKSVRVLLAEAFWNHVGVQSDRCIHCQWFHVKTFDRFVKETGAVSDVSDVNSTMLLRYVEWLNSQRRPSGIAWSKSTRAGAFTALRKLLQWLERCRPGSIAAVAYPINPFPWRNRDTPARPKVPPRELRAILRACEEEIQKLRDGREMARLQLLAEKGDVGSLGWLLEQIDRKFGGVVPLARELGSTGNRFIANTLRKHGGLKRVEPLLYARAESLLPYYLAILIHTAGNPDPIAELRNDCLQRLPLLEDRVALVWLKPRANSIQRRTFSTVDRFEPPMLIKEILSWNERLLAHCPADLSNRLFLYKGVRGVAVLTSAEAKRLVRGFCERHGLPRFSLASIRPGVLTSFYRASGDLRRVSAVANHANLSTTVRYVETPETKAQHKARIADLQSSFVGHIGKTKVCAPTSSAVPAANDAVRPGGKVVTMFGFDCGDPYAGSAPGSRRGELCTHFMGCFTCPNAIITGQPKMLARLLQAKEHLRAAEGVLHPARWRTLYEPQLRILEEDILPRFSSHELASAAPLMRQLPPLPDLR